YPSNPRETGPAKGADRTSDACQAHTLLSHQERAAPMKKPCGRVGCPRLVDVGTKYCEEHTRADNRRRYLKSKSSYVRRVGGHLARGGQAAARVEAVDRLRLLERTEAPEGRVRDDATRRHPPAGRLGLLEAGARDILREERPATSEHAP